MVEVKLCGMTDPVDVALAVELGADYVGVVLADSPRRLTGAGARTVLAPMRGTPVRAAGVFGATAADVVVTTASDLALDVVQLHDPGTADSVSGLATRLRASRWATIRVGSLPMGHAERELFGAADAIVLDTRSGPALGGTGKAFDWERAAGEIEGFRSGVRLIVAGGLNAENVGAAIAALRPDVVDVSSGIESSRGRKDPRRMRAFVAAVRNGAHR